MNNEYIKKIQPYTSGHWTLFMVLVWLNKYGSINNNIVWSYGDDRSALFFHVTDVNYPFKSVLAPMLTICYHWIAFGVSIFFLIIKKKKDGNDLQTKLILGRPLSSAS